MPGASIHVSIMSWRLSPGPIVGNDRLADGLEYGSSVFENGQEHIRESLVDGRRLVHNPEIRLSPCGRVTEAGAERGWRRHDTRRGIFTGVIELLQSCR